MVECAVSRIFSPSGRVMAEATIGMSTRSGAQGDRLEARFGERPDDSSGVLDPYLHTGRSGMRLVVATAAGEGSPSKSRLSFTGGKVRPSTDALERLARATRTRLTIVFESST